METTYEFRILARGVELRTAGMYYGDRMIAIRPILKGMKRPEVNLTFNNLPIIDNNEFAVKEVICHCGF
jgi:hypothetical protein